MQVKPHNLVAGSVDINNDLVLVVDDVRLNREMLGLMLEGIGLRVLYAANGQEGVESFSQHRPCLVLMDIYMPVMDGIEATRQIKKIAADAFVPIMVISGSGEGSVINDVVEAGADDFVQRPFSTEILQAKVTAMLRVRHLYHQLEKMHHLRKHEEEIAEQLFSRAVESGGVIHSGMRMHKQPAETFSGDVLLSASRPNGDVNVLLGDFTGHGLTATIGALPLSETFKTMTAKGFDAAEILTQINIKLHRILPRGMFLAVGMVSLSAGDGTVRLWNGGLPDLLIKKGRGEALEKVRSSHPPLGILPEVGELQFSVYSLTEHDRILMLSDGVSEAVGASGEQFGEDRLESLVMCCNDGQSISDQIISELQRFGKGEVQRDDISIIELPGRISQSAPKDLLNKDQGEPELEEERPETGVQTVLDSWVWTWDLKGRSLARVNPVAQAMSRLQETEGQGEHWHNLFSVLTELYVNALDHGVLGLDSSIKSSPDGFVAYFHAREERLSNLSSGSVRLLLEHKRFEQGGELYIKINDSGEGFDYEKWLNNSGRGNDNVALSGRGISLVSQLTSHLRYSQNGTCAEAIYSYKDTA